MRGPTPTISVVVPAYRAWKTLPRVLDALEPQVARAGAEAVLVESTGERSAERIRARWPWLEVIVAPSRLLPGAARNVGIARSHGELVAFLDADSLPEPGWLEALVAGLDHRADAVAGSVVNGTPRSAIGTAEYLLEFSELLPERSKPLRHGATCNLLVRRQALEGGFRTDLRVGEDTILTFPLAARGRLAFAPTARVRHLNRTALRAFFGHQRALGASFGEVCAAVPFPHHGLARPALAPLAGAGRLLAIVGRLRVAPAQLARALTVAPLLIAGLAAWSLGLARPHS